MRDGGGQIEGAVSGVVRAPLRVLVESIGGGVAVHWFPTRIAAMVFVDDMLAERAACRLTVCEGDVPAYVIVRSGNVWREQSP